MDGTIIIRLFLTNSMEQSSASEAIITLLVKNILASYQTEKFFILIPYSPQLVLSQA
jgi:hypothetical protein